MKDELVICNCNGKERKGMSNFGIQVSKYIIKNCKNTKKKEEIFRK